MIKYSITDEDILHYGTPRHSGRYPWGSGEDPEQRNKSFLGRVEELKKQGLTQVEIAEGLGMNTSQLRARTSIAKAELRKSEYIQATKLKEKGMSNVAIAKQMGLKNESSVRSLLNKNIQERSELAMVTVNMLKDAVAKKEYLDVGIGVERFMGVSRTKLKTSIDMLRSEGYLITYPKVEQLGTGKKTSVMVLSKPKDKETVEMLKLLNDSEIRNDASKRLGINKDDVNMEAEVAKILNTDESNIKNHMKEAFADVYKNQDKIRSITNYSEDGGRSYLGLEPIKSVDSKRVMIRYGDKGGSDKDGLIELRRGVDDISLGKANYAQVRIGVDGTHYMKGMAVYSDDLPKGVDMIYNTNKASGTSPDKVFKEMKTTQDGNIDMDNPFGATVKQRHYQDSKGKDQLSSINIVNEEGEWRDKWSKSLSSQMLSKQSPALAKQQLETAYNIKKEEFEVISSLTNPAVKKRLLDSFADDCDSAAVHLKAAALPRSGWHALIPFPTMKETEVYAPNFRDGERIVLIRYPHGGIFEIPELTVNNRHKEANTVLKQAKDAIGIHPKVAEQLSGADFDGDAVLAIPNPKSVGIKTSSPLKGLLNFDPKTQYKAYDGMITIDGGVYNESTGKVDFGGRKPQARTKQMKMGDISNLITDMTIRGANTDEIAAAVRHSMVVIDSEKHKLNYKQSYIDNGIAGLKKKYQGSERSGASTLIAKASSDRRVNTRKELVNIKRMTPEQKKDYLSGKKIYEYTNESYVNSKGKEVFRKIKSTKMAEEQDAFKLSSGTPIESIYATHANKLKALANQIRKESIETRPILQNKEAKEKYKEEIKSLNGKLNTALMNAPLERQALVFANSTVAAKKADNPNLEASDIKKIKSQAMNEARARIGAGKIRVEIEDREWEAIQAGAISNNKLSQILNNTDIDKIKQLATPRAAITISPVKKAKAERMLSSGYTQAEVADQLGISTSALAKLFD